MANNIIYSFRRCLAVLLLEAVLTGCAATGPTPTLAALPTQAAASATLVHTSTTAPSATATTAVTAANTPTPLFTMTVTPTTAPAAARIPIIEYHDPDFKMGEQVQMTIPWFEEQMKWLADSQYQALSGEELSGFLDGTAVFPNKSVVIGFDVGSPKKQIYTDTVIPTLKKYKFKAVFFILANDTVVTDDCARPLQFCWNDFKQWADDGIISIASHGLFHPDFAKLTPPQIKYEVETARTILLEKTGRLPVGFAFPFDSATPAASTLVKNAGYRFAVAGNTRLVLAATPNDPDRFKLPRVYPYSNFRVFPNLEAFNRPFSEVIGALTRPVAGMSVLPPTPTPLANLTQPGANRNDPPPLPAQKGENAIASDAVLQYCKNLPSEPQLRLTQMLQSSFTSDVSAEAQAKLPGLSTSISCNALPGNKPEAIVVHYTVGDLTASMYGFRQPKGTSSHYLIDRDGKVMQMVPENLAAMHVSCTGNRVNCIPSCPICDDAAGNLTEPYMRSIGIELVNRGHVPAIDAAPMVYEDYLRSFSYPYWEDYTQAQIDSLKVLVQDIAARWKIPMDTEHVYGHYRINQKVDPGPALNLFWTRSGNPSRPAIFDIRAPTP